VVVVLVSVCTFQFRNHTVLEVEVEAMVVAAEGHSLHNEYVADDGNRGHKQQAAGEWTWERLVPTESRVAEHMHLVVGVAYVVDAGVGVA
jgi:hypothetical protein